ncbi:MAG: ABC transporter permease [Bacillota bacterium]
MLNIIKFNLLKLKNDYTIIVLMTILTLGLTFAFNLGFNSGYKTRVDIVNKNGNDEIIKELLEDKKYNFKLSDKKTSEIKLLNNRISAILVLEDDIVKIISLKKDVEIMSFKNFIKEKFSIINNKKSIVESINKNIPNTNKEDIQKRVNDSYKYRKILKVEEISNYTEEKIPYNHNFFGFSIYFISFTLVYGIANILKEKENNTWDRLLIFPMKRDKVILGNMIVTVLIGIIQLIIIFGLGSLLFDLNILNNWINISIILILYLFTITSIGLFISTIVDTHAQLSTISPVVLTSSAMIGGCMWPLEVVSSKVMLLLSNFVPQKWVIQGIKKTIVYNANLNEIFIELLIILLFGLFFYILGMYRVRNESI